MVPFGIGKTPQKTTEMSTTVYRGAAKQSPIVNIRKSKSVGDHPNRSRVHMYLNFSVILQVFVKFVVLGLVTDFLLSCFLVCNKFVTLNIHEFHVLFVK